MVVLGGGGVTVSDQVITVSDYELKNGMYLIIRLCQKLDRLNFELLWCKVM